MISLLRFIGRLFGRNGDATAAGLTPHQRALAEAMGMKLGTKPHGQVSRGLQALFARRGERDHAESCFSRPYFNRLGERCTLR